MPQATASVKPAVNMVLGQLLTNRVLDENIINALLAVPREHFLPQQLRGAAYVDENIELGPPNTSWGRVLPAPLTFAYMLQAANLERRMRVLDIACAGGYTSAVLSHLAEEVVACESVRELAEAARRNLDALNIPNVRVAYVTSLVEGYTADQPYDVIMVNGAIRTVPHALLAMLKPGGRLVAVEAMDAPRAGLTGAAGRIVTYMHGMSGAEKLVAREAALPLLTDFEPPPAFHF